MNEKECIVGIDLGTTFSEIAAFVDGKVEVIGSAEKMMLPSVVGISPEGKLLVGEPARNQLLLFPENSVQSIKRIIGSNETVKLGSKTFSPQEISAFILEELIKRAVKRLGHPVKKAIITVPAYFSDAQRNATHEAGELAGLEVVRILNEPTAASLAYGADETKSSTSLIYDLGGGTFDVSIVTIEDDVTEVLASHGNNRLGGDDFDQLILDRLFQEFNRLHGIDLREKHKAACSRLRFAAEEAKKKLSFEPYVNIREEALVTAGGKPLHLDLEITRTEFENMIRSLVESTLVSVSRAMEDAGKQPDDIDEILLVGGSTRIPLITQTLEERTGLTPRQDIHPDLCVALGAGVLASRLAGHDIKRVLVDVSPFSFGPSFMGELNGMPYFDCYKPIIKRNTPLPVTRTESYGTSHPYQNTVEVKIYQGDDPDALKNILVGSFKVEGLTEMEESNEVLCRMNLDIDGILNVTAIEKLTGKSKNITISNSLQPKSEAEISLARKRLHEFYPLNEEESDEEGIAYIDESDDEKIIDFDHADDVHSKKNDDWIKLQSEARALIEKSRLLLDKMHDEDKEEAIDLHEIIETAVTAEDITALSEGIDELKELLFFIEGK